MPTGYTAGLYEGEQSFEDFVWSCARGMGALVTMRDEPLDATIPEKFEPSSYYADRIEEAEEELRFLIGLTDDEAQILFEGRLQVLRKKVADDAVRQADIERRYRVVLNKLRVWQPAPVLRSFREFMIQQIEESIKHDCVSRMNMQFPYADHNEWLEDEKAKKRQDIVYYEKQFSEEVARVKERNDWLKTLRQELATLDI